MPAAPVATPASVATNLVLNGSFEIADADRPEQPRGWDLPDGLGIQWETAPTTDDGIVRGRAIRMDTRVSERDMVASWRKAGLDQWDIPRAEGNPIAATYGLSYYSIPIAAGTNQSYRISFDVLAPGDGAKVWVRGYAPARDGTLRRSYETVVHCRTPPGQWQREERVFTPAKSRADIRELRVMLYAYWPAGVYWFDNVRLEPVAAAGIAAPAAADRPSETSIDARRLPSILSNPSILAEVPAHRRYGAWNSGRIGGGGYLQHASFSPADPDRIYTDLARLEGAPAAKANDRTVALRSALGGGGPAAVESFPAAASPLVVNGDMAAGDAVPAEWKLSGGANEQRKLVRDTAVFASAPASLRLDVQGTAAMAHQRLAGNPGGRTVEAYCRMRLDGTFKPVQFVLQCFDGGWKQVAWRTVAQTSKTGEWVELHGKVALPANASNVMVGVLVDGSGSVWLDDVSVVYSGSEPAAAAAPPMQPPAQVVAATDARIHYAGRWDVRDANGPRAAWPGSAATVRFRGTSLAVQLQEPNANRYEVMVDGKRHATVVPGKGLGWRVLADGLPDGDHTVMLVKRTESFFGVVQVRAWGLEADAELLPARRPARALEFIGDSITCGYGNEAPDQTHKFNAETENAAAAYGFLAAQALGADYTAVAWSGKRLWPGNSILDLYGRTLPQDESSVWDFAAARHPDAVLINLGTNDFAGGNPEEDGWVGAYVAFVQQLRRQYPAARIYCAAGPMMSDTWSASKTALSTIRGYLRRVVVESGDDNIAFLEFPMQDGSTGFGADWHPSVKTHRRMADQLSATLRADLGW